MNSLWLVLGASMAVAGCSAPAEQDDAATEDELRRGPRLRRGMAFDGDLTPGGAELELSYVESRRLPVARFVANQNDVVVLSARNLEGSTDFGFPGITLLDASLSPVRALVPRHGSRELTMRTRVRSKGTYFVAVPGLSSYPARFGLKLERLFREGETPVTLWRSWYMDPAASYETAANFDSTPADRCVFTPSANELRCGGAIDGASTGVASDGTFGVSLYEGAGTNRLLLRQVEGQMLPGGYLVFTKYFRRRGGSFDWDYEVVKFTKR